MRIQGPFSTAEVERHLRETVIPLRLGVVSARGHPLVLSLWFTWRDGALWCATSRNAQVVAMLRRDPRCGFEVARDAPPYCGVRGRGAATLVPERGGEILEALVDRYLETRESEFARWLLARRDDETAIRIAPERVTSWDFRARMAPG